MCKSHSMDFSDSAMFMEAILRLMNISTRNEKTNVSITAKRNESGLMFTSKLTASAFIRLITYMCRETPITSPTQAPMAGKQKIFAEHIRGCNRSRQHNLGAAFFV